MHILLNEIERAHKTIQSLQTEVQSLKMNYSKVVLQDVGELQRELKNSQSSTTQNHQELVKHVNEMERNFQFHKEIFDNFKAECKITQDGITQANPLPLRFIINNIEELVSQGEGHLSPYFYTACRRHKLRLTVFPGGKDDAKDQFISVWLHRISNFGIQNRQLPERVKIQVVVELVSQLPHATDADNHVVSIDTIVQQNQQAEVISMKNDFIPIAALPRAERRRTFSIRHIQYKIDNSLIFIVRSAVEAHL